ncbi:MAG TPA: DUF4147 domain-containing protein, partial [Candidatus Brocadiia bacterium]|nr:DUF4147 domain-containing protein [Candidatus Brocadiia bacterium]
MPPPITRLTPRQTLQSIFEAGLRAADPAAAVRGAMQVSDGLLTIGAASWPLDSFHRILILGAGKASAVMAAEAESILPRRVDGGVISVKYGHTAP